MEIDNLRYAIVRCWSRETSYDPIHWTTSNPAWGHCAVTALIVHDYLGGEIVRVEVVLRDGLQIPHYFNRLPNRGEVCDLTWEQFPEGTVARDSTIDPSGGACQRNHILAYEDTVRRYRALSSGVRSELSSGRATGTYSGELHAPTSRHST